jgi:hypothetical protein
MVGRFPKCAIDYGERRISAEYDYPEKTVMMFRSEWRNMEIEFNKGLIQLLTSSQILSPTETVRKRVGRC